MIKNRALLTNENHKESIVASHIGIAGVRTKHYNIFVIQGN
jgi:hypothetical protein